MIKALHVFANHKITGPAELALETARWLSLTNSNIQTSFYSSSVKNPGEKRDRWLQHLARERQVPEPPWQNVTLPKHFSPMSAFFDVRKITKNLAQQSPDLVHTHTANDHILVGMAARKVSPTIPIIRTLYDGHAPKPGIRTRYAFSKLTDALICFSNAVADELRNGSHGLAPETIHVLGPPIDTDRFDPSRPLPNIKESLGIADSAPVYGIVARMQTHRRFEILIAAMKIVSREMPESRAIIVGRGTNQQSVARDPVAKEGLSEHCIFSGYLKNDDYVGVLKAMDVKVFLVPGSDGTCRAAREALSMGVPVIAARRGMLPEIVSHDQTGLIVDDSPEQLAAEIIALLRDTDKRQKLSAKARQHSVDHGSFQSFTRSVAKLYEQALEMKSPAL